MKIMVDIQVGKFPGRAPTKKDMSEQIFILEKVIEGEPLSAGDIQQLFGVKSILEGIKGKI